jgi:8-oxo-dGTP pyrophosphatase MutT (NUDIX family)
MPGGKNESSDLSNLDTAIRECKEEIGIDLGSPDFILLGTLKHRNIKTLDTGKLAMILIPHGT